MSSPFTITEIEANNLAQAILNGARLNFTNQANRNWVAKIVRQKYGIPVHKSSIRNQLMDLRYTVENPDNRYNDYKTYVSAVYMLERDKYYSPSRVW